MLTVQKILRGLYYIVLIPLLPILIPLLFFFFLAVVVPIIVITFIASGEEKSGILFAHH